MPDNLARDQFWIGLLVRGFCGALVGFFLCLGCLPHVIGEDAESTWLYFTAIMIIFAVLAARYGDFFWTNIIGWFD